MEIARKFVRALVSTVAEIVFVTAMFALAEEPHPDPQASIVFLRADRQAGGSRTLRLLTGARAHQLRRRLVPEVFVVA